MWETDKGLDVTAAFKGITTPIRDIYSAIEQTGWEPSVELKDNEYVAVATAPHGETMEATGRTEATAAGHLLMKVMRHQQMRPPITAAWSPGNFTDKLETIAKAYAEAPIYDPKAAPAWKELGDDSTRRADVLRQQLKVEVVDAPEPYATPQEMADDIHKKKHIYVSRAHSDHPVWTEEQNVNFRLVHDVMGHAVSGGDFGWQGENQACAAHFPLLTPSAQQALFTECIAQTAYAAYYRAFGPQKVAFISDHMDPAQEQENPAGHQGEHPSQMVAPTSMPTVPGSPPVGLPWQSVAPHMDNSFGPIPVLTKVASNTMYHVAPVDRREKIESMGLAKAPSAKGYKIHKPGTYLWGDLDKAKQYALNQSGMHGDHEVYEVDANGLRLLPDDIQDWEPDAWRTHSPIGPERVRRISAAYTSAGESARSWHLTDNPQFKMDPDYQPINNTTFGGSWPHKGIFTSPSPEDWFNGYDYVQPYVAEIEHPPLENFKGYNGEGFLPADQFPHSQVKRVIPTAEYFKEKFGMTPFDDGKKFENYRYEGPDVRDMSPEQYEPIAQELSKHVDETRPHTHSVQCPDCQWEGSRGECWDDGRCPACDRGKVEKTAAGFAPIDPEYSRYVSFDHDSDKAQLISHQKGHHDNASPGEYPDCPDCNAKTSTSQGLSPEQLAQLTAEHGQYGYHKTLPWAVDNIEQNGIDPGNPHFNEGYEGSTPGHGYLWTGQRANQDGSPEAHFRVDLNKLDPSRMRFDADNASLIMDDKELADMHPGSVYEIGPQVAKDPRFRHPDAVAKSLAQGSIAYEGAIPPHAIERNPTFWNDPKRVQNLEERAKSHNDWMAQGQRIDDEYKAEQAAIPSRIVGQHDGHVWDAEGNVWQKDGDAFISKAHPPSPVENAMQKDGIESAGRRDMKKKWDAITSSTASNQEDINGVKIHWYGPGSYSDANKDYLSIWHNPTTNEMVTGPANVHHAELSRRHGIDQTNWHSKDWIAGQILKQHNGEESYVEGYGPEYEKEIGALGKQLGIGTPQADAWDYWQFGIGDKANQEKTATPSGCSPIVHVEFPDGKTQILEGRPGEHHHELYQQHGLNDKSDEEMDELNLSHGWREPGGKLKWYPSETPEEYYDDAASSEWEFPKSATQEDSSTPRVIFHKGEQGDHGVGHPFIYDFRNNQVHVGPSGDFHYNMDAAHTDHDTLAGRVSDENIAWYGDNWEHPHKQKVVNALKGADLSLQDLTDDEGEMFNWDWADAQNDKGYGGVSKDWRFTKRMAAGFAPVDPNKNWDPGVNPNPQNAYLFHSDPLSLDQTKENAAKLDSDWINRSKQEMKQAIVNAFRAVLLSPRKDLRWNAIHYQDIMHIPANESDPKRYWDALEQRRVDWNTARGYTADSHLEHVKWVKLLKQRIKLENQKLTDHEAQELADRDFMEMCHEEEQKLLDNKKLTAQEIQNKVQNRVGKRLKMMLNPKIDPKVDVGQTSLLTEAAAQLDFQGQQAGKYGAFMMTHLKAISQISDHADEILDAAIKDVKDGGSGHDFRAKVLSLGVSGVGPKVCSFAWLLLQPMTSQLATIDVHMMDILGHDYDKDMNHRDYFKFERELQAARDSSGYNHMPLGQYQWATWDMKRNGEGEHQDHSALRVLDPTPHYDVDWQDKRADQADWNETAPQWWQDTQPAREQVGQQWDTDVASQFPQNTIPHLGKLSYQGMSTDKSIKHWFDYLIDKSLSRLLRVKDADLLAEYFVGEGASRKKSRTFLHTHKDKIGDYEPFQKAFFEKFDHMKNSSVKKSISLRIPWVYSSNRIYVGRQGQTFMELAKEALGLDTQTVWEMIPKEEFAVGSWDSETQELFCGERLPPWVTDAITQKLTGH